MRSLASLRAAVSAISVHLAWRLDSSKFRGRATLFDTPSGLRVLATCAAWMRARASVRTWPDDRMRKIFDARALSNPPCVCCLQQYRLCSPAPARTRPSPRLEVQGFSNSHQNFATTGDLWLAARRANVGRKSKGTEPFRAGWRTGSGAQSNAALGLSGTSGCRAPRPAPSAMVCALEGFCARAEPERCPPTKQIQSLTTINGI